MLSPEELQIAWPPWPSNGKKEKKSLQLDRIITSNNRKTGINVVALVHQF